MYWFVIKRLTIPGLIRIMTTTQPSSSF